jgi:hypothetical protein
LPSWIEFHDSTLTAIKQSVGTLEIVLDAYVHRWELLGDEWRGTGWEQPVRIRMQNAVGPSATPALPTEILDGELRTKGLAPGALVPLPFELPGDFALSLQLLDGIVIDITGRGLRVEALSGGRFVENLPEEMRPDATK